MAFFKDYHRAISNLLIFFVSDLLGDSDSSSGSGGSSDESDSEDEGKNSLWSQNEHYKGESMLLPLNIGNGQ